MSQSDQPEGVAVDRGVRPHAIRLASQLQTAAYSHGYEDGHPANAASRKAKYSDQAQRLRVALCEEIERLIAERDAARAEAAEKAALADSEGTRAVAYLRRARKAEALLGQFEPLRARGVVDADDNLDCWDTEPFELCQRQVAALNEKDPAAQWRVVELWARELPQPLACMRPTGPNGEPCGLMPPCPDCGRACHDVPQGA